MIDFAFLTPVTLKGHKRSLLRFGEKRGPNLELDPPKKNT